MVMKITFAQILFAVVFTSLTHAASEGRAQEIMERMVTIHAQNAELRNVLRDIEAQADVKFAYSQKNIRAERTVDVHINRQKLSAALSSLLDPLHIAYELTAGRILLTAETGAVTEPQQTEPAETLTAPALAMVKGRVIDENNAGLPGVSVIIKGTQKGTTTDQEGAFGLEVAEQNAVLVFSFVGYKPQEVTVGGQTNISVTMQPDNQSLEEVVVGG